jgi:hypothetical protein
MIQQSQPLVNVAENHNDALQAANLYLRGSPRDHFLNCARAGTFSQASGFETTPYHVTDQCSSVVAGPFNASAADSHTGPGALASNADLIALEPHRGENLNNLLSNALVKRLVKRLLLSGLRS